MNPSKSLKSITFTKKIQVIFPNNFEQKIGFDVIREILAGSCLSPLGKQFVEKISFSPDAGTVKRRLRQTEEFRQILAFHGNFPAQDYYDMTSELVRIRIAGTYLEPEHLAQLNASLTSILRILKFLDAQPPEKFPEVYLLKRDVAIDPAVLKKIVRIIDERAEIRDDASPELKKIRKDRNSKLASVEKKIMLSLKTARQSGWTPDDAEVTIRNGRLVIPLLATHKRSITGFIHDQSSTGHTVYLEPAEVLETNNEIRELDYAERREIIRILIEFTDFLRPYSEELIEAYHFLGLVDYIRAKALFALHIHGLLPKNIVDTPFLDWRDAVHPLLFLSHEKLKKQVIPLTISLNSEQRILVISGPNAGGKSVCLKTVGLLQYMFQCGLLPPVREDSEFGIFERIFIDIGDEQSLENDLSTYTSKLYNIKFFLEHLNEKSIFLIDEFGTGTDPSMGGSIAEASLEKINLKKAFGVVTTHYSNLKLLAGRVDGIFNGAMLFDSAKIRPLYQLKTGKPGSSFAFEIARQIGFPEDVLQKASTLTGKSQLDFDRELQDLEVEKDQIIKKSTELNVADEFLNELIQKYKMLTENLEASKKEIIQKAKDEALRILNTSNSIIEKTIKEIRESQAEKEKTKSARTTLIKLKEKLVEEPPEPTPQPSGKEQVFHDLSSIRIPAGPAVRPAPARPRVPYQSFYDDLHVKLQNFQMTLDLRGKRADEAHSLIQRYIDDAQLLSIPEVRILHGKGNGTLRQITRDYLKTVKEIKKYQDERIEAGGAGITVVQFR